jgi:hypothetical protein
MEFRLWISDKLDIISTPKMASRFLDEIFYGRNHKLTHSNFFKLKEDISIVADNNILSEELDYIFSNKNKKDILIIYRNPVNKFVSGSLQDLDSVLSDTKDNLFLIDYIIKNEPKFFPFLFLNNNTLKTKIENGDDTDFNEYYMFFAKLFIEFNIKNNIETYHSQNYLHLIYTLINEKITNKSKIRLLDLDSSESTTLSDFLLSYEIKEKIEATKYSKKSLSNFIKKQLLNDVELSAKIHLNLNTQIFFYNLLKNNKQNL